jgi:hypothetical protein
MTDTLLPSCRWPVFLSKEWSVKFKFVLAVIVDKVEFTLVNSLFELTFSTILALYFLGILK